MLVANTWKARYSVVGVVTDLQPQQFFKMLAMFAAQNIGQTFVFAFQVIEMISLSIAVTVFVAIDLHCS
ncbi:hypothetical protein D3C73_1538150 [compost metagenome]